MIRPSAQIRPARDPEVPAHPSAGTLPAALAALVLLCAGCSTGPGPGGAGMPSTSAASGTQLPPTSARQVPPARPDAQAATSPSGHPSPAPGEGHPPTTSPPGALPPCPATAVVEEAEWVERGDGPALRVRPHEDLRGCGGPLSPTVDLPPGWSDLVRRVPDADSPGMREQYDCHLRLAPRKEVWHLEPWRPVVTDAQMLGSLCNPGAPDADLQAP